MTGRRRAAVKTVTGPSDHVVIVGAGLGGLATALHLAGRLPDALAAFIAVATQRSRLLGPAHPDSLASRVGLALARADSGDTAAAVPGLTAALDDAEQSVGPNTVSTVTIRIHLADCHAELGNVHDAVEGLSRAAAASETVLGVGSPLVVALRGEASALARGLTMETDGAAPPRQSDRVAR